MRWVGSVADAIESCLWGAMVEMGDLSGGSWLCGDGWQCHVVSSRCMC